MRLNTNKQLIMRTKIHKPSSRTEALPCSSKSVTIPLNKYESRRSQSNGKYGEFVQPQSAARTTSSSGQVNLFF